MGFIKELLKKTFTYKIYNKYKTAKKKRKFEADCRLLQDKGLDIMRRFDECMKSLNIKYTLGFGTLLGAVREHGFIQHDDDIDYTMWIDDYRPEMINALEQYGIKLIHSFSVENDKYGKEDTFICDGILVDIFYVYKPVDELPYCCWFIDQPGCHSRKKSIKKFGGLFTRRIELPMSRNIVDAQFYNLQLPIPENYREILSCRYGSDYMVPKPGAKGPTEYIKDWPDKVGKFIEH